MVPKRIILLAFLVQCAVCAGAEKWADSKLTVKEGLELWFDATTEKSARQSTRYLSLRNNQPVDFWHDGSGNKRHLVQRIPKFRPQFKEQNELAWMLFDGADDYLSAHNLGQSFTNSTLFIVAAPKSNAGFFRGFAGFAQSGRNDYTTGLNLDLGPTGTRRLEVVNAEGAGFNGANDLLQSTHPLQTFHCFVLAVGTTNFGLRLDGKEETTRRRNPAAMSMDEFVIGARLYSNTQEPAFAQGNFDGAICEFLLFSRLLSPNEISQVENYLSAKYAPIKSLTLGGTVSARLEVENPPLLQMLIPGFAADELPLELNNINNLKYRHDGKLVALGYNGKIYVLEDTNGDGLEDKSSIWWDKSTLRGPLGFTLTPKDYPHGNGLIVASKGKVSLILDKDGDDRGDEERVIATGWPELPHGVDTLGLTMGSDGAIYFGLGTANFTDAYLIDKNTGTARYSLTNERGTILRISPDLSKREIFATGIRFPVALAFNKAGDLFCTDQEGATWLPNGNPFDELLHIQKDRHYGFPPRHPKHLPNVIDEPSVYDYKPQHQSTCGLNFNDATIFGPEQWRDDAIVTGYSRGKLYRTKLVKTPTGYVAQNQIIGSMNMLPADAVVAPDGALVIAVHSGLPDWGSGPDGKGKLVKVRYQKDIFPLPVAVYLASPNFIHINFDRALQGSDLRGAEIKIGAGPHLSAGDRFEFHRPGYQVVQDQLNSATKLIPVLSRSLSPDGKTLILEVPARRTLTTYALAISLPTQKPKGTIKQFPALDLEAGFHGVIAGDTWLPHLDTEVSSRLGHRIKAPAVLKTQLDLSNMLEPAVQPGSILDFTPQPEKVSVNFYASAKFTVNGKASQDKQGKHVLTITATQTNWLPVEVHLDSADLSVTWQSDRDNRERSFPLHRFILPWAIPAEKVETKEKSIPELAGGDWAQGKKIFFSDKAACSKCHQVQGQGGSIGPDLSNLIHRDYVSVKRDILTPNAAINPDHIASIIETKDGETYTGLVASDKPRGVDLFLVSGQVQFVPRPDIKSIFPAKLSLMPEAYGEILTPEEQKHLLTYLLTAPLSPAPLEIPGEPPARKLSEFRKLLTNERSATKPLHIHLAAGPKDHGPGEHDYPLWLRRWEKLLALAENVKVTSSMEWPSEGHFEKADVVIFYSNNPGWNADRANQLDKFLQRGGGLVYIHYAVDGHKHVDELADRIGLAWRGGGSKFRHGALDLKFHTHPISTGFTNSGFIDESYWQLVGNTESINLVATGDEEGKPQPLMWAKDSKGGRVFVSIPGHYNWTFDDPVFRLLILRGIAWTSKNPLDRLAELATIGARVAE